MNSSKPSEARLTFRHCFERHVANVKANDLTAVLADFDPASLPGIFDRVRVPRGAVSSAEVVAVVSVADHWIGKAAYEDADGLVGVRSLWYRSGDGWAVRALENFDPLNDNRSSERGGQA